MTLSGDYLFLGLIILGAFLMYFCTVRRNILLAFSSSIIWLSLGVWLWFASTPIFGLVEDWSRLLIWVFFILTFVPWLLFADTEVQYQKDGKSWKEYGGKPSLTIEDASVRYKRELQSRLGKVRRR